MNQVIFLVVFATSIISVHSQCCLQFKAGKCIKCPAGMHLYRSNCIYDIPNCESYMEGFDCAKCKAGYQFNIISSQCDKIIQPQNNNNQNSASVTHEDIAIVISSPSGPYAQSYLLSEEYVRITRPEITTAITTGALIRKYSNGNINVIIEFRALDNKLYQSITKADLSSPILEQISFNQINALTIPQQKKQSPPVTTKLNLQTASQSQEFLIADTFVRGQNSSLKAIKQGEVTTYSNKTYIFELIYIGTQAGSEYQAIIEIVGDSLRATIQSIKQIKAPTPETNQTLNANNNLAPSGQPYRAYKPSQNDIGYLIAFDFLTAQKNQYNGLTPTSIQISIKSGIQYYRLRFTLVGGSQWQVRMNTNTQIFVATIQSQTQIKAGAGTTTTAQPEYQQIDSSNFYKDYRFIPALDYVITQSRQKYYQAPIKSLHYLEEGDNVKFKVVLLQGGYQWNVQVQFNSVTFVASGFTQKRGTKLPADNNNTNTNTNNNNNSNNNSNTNTNTSTNNNTNNNNTNTNTNTNTNNNTNTNANNNTNTNTNNNTNANTNSNNTSNNNTNNNSVIVNKTDTTEPISTQVPQAVKSKVLGLTQVTDEELKAGTFRQIDDLLRSVNPNQLKNAALIAAYYQAAGFIRNYKIFYRRAGDPTIYQGQVAQDLLRRKVYVVSFGRLGF